MKYFRVLIIIVIGLFFAGYKSEVVPKVSGSTKTSKGSRRLNPGSLSLTSAEKSDIETADNPADLSKSGWKLVIMRTKQALKDKQLSTQAAALGYYATLTFFPALLGSATLYATVTSPQNLLDMIAGLQGIVPPAIYDLIDQQLRPLVRAEKNSIGVAAVASLAALLWTTSGGIQNLIKSTNIAYEVDESRGYVRLRIVSVLLSGALLLLVGVVLVLLVLQRDALLKLGLPSGISTLFPYLRWPILIVIITIALSIVYRYAPDRKASRWSWVSWGATAATIIWLTGTSLFFYYAQNFGNFNKTYGIFAGIIVLMTWFNLTALIVLIGAQVNKKLEEVTDADTVT